MSTVTTVSTSTAALKVPYTCRCAFCGATIHAEDAISAAGYAYTGGYASAEQKQLMGISSSFRANTNLPFELEYAEKRLEHYRDTVDSGKLKQYLETGKARKEDYFKVEAGSDLESYLKSKANKSQGQVQQDTARLTAWPYQWRDFGKNTAVKCPECGKAQPFCESLSSDGRIMKSFLLGFCLFAFAGLVPFMAGLQLPPELRFLAVIPLVLGFAAWFVIYRLLRKKRFRQIAALPWRAEDLPVYDAEFLTKTRAQFEAQHQMYKDMGWTL